MKEIPGYEKLYACDKEGNVYSLPRIIIKANGWGRLFEWYLPLKKMSPCTRKDGYLGVHLRKNGKGKSVLVHRLIGMAFLGLRDDQELNHVDGNKINNNLSNLEISTRSENCKHAFRIGLRSHKGSNHPRFYINQDIKDKVKELLASGLSQDVIASKVGIAQTSVSTIKLNKR
jgi:hypothetical protein